jgi:DNA end-binding protein Ku
MPRAIWKGAISFGLVHVPVALYPASNENSIDFDWLDKRSMDPVGYKRINKRTGKEVASEHIVRGVKVAGGDYVVLGDDEIRTAYPKTTQTIAIESFVSPTQLPFTLLEKPYYLEPLARGEKVYALLREAMLAAGVVGVARVVMHTKEHLSALVPAGPALMLDTLRWAQEIRPWTDLKLPPEGSHATQLKAAELKMAGQLIADMTEDWQGERYEDRFTQALVALVEQRAAAGRTEQVQPLEANAEAAAANVVDLTELLKRSLGRGKPAAAASAAAPAAKKASAPRRRATRRRA